MAFKTEHPFVPLVVTKGDLMLASVLLGFFIGFGYFAVYNTYLETRRANRFTTYIFLCWGEILSCIAYALLAYLHLVGSLPSSFGLFFGIATAWTIQVHFLLQIIVNRVCILLVPKTRLYLKVSVALVWTLICASVYIIWIPAQLQISDRWMTINLYWDRTEKCLYLVTDAALNYFFIHVVKTRLVNYGLTKYDSLVQFNRNIVFVSLTTDACIIGLMSLPNKFVYCQFHSVAYIVKLLIEITMSRLIIKVAQSTGITEYNEQNFSSIANGHSNSANATAAISRNLEVRVNTHILTEQDEDHELSDAKSWVHNPDLECDHDLGVKQPSI